MRQFVGELAAAPLSELEPYIRRGDFSRWIRDVFGDYPLATELAIIEQRHRPSHAATIEALTEAITSRYDLAGDALDAVLDRDAA